MTGEGMLGGSLFAGEFLSEAVREFPEWKQARADLTSGIGARLRDIRGRFPAREGTSEAVTEDEFIWKVLGSLGWTAALRQQNLSLRGHHDIPDGLLFTSEEDKTQALGVREEAHRYNQWRLSRRVEALGPEPRPPLGFPADRAGHPDAPLSAGGAHRHRRPAALGDPDERGALAALPLGGAVGGRGVLRGGPGGGSRRGLDALWSGAGGEPRRPHALRAVLPAGVVRAARC